MMPAIISSVLKFLSCLSILSRHDERRQISDMVALEAIVANTCRFGENLYVVIV